MKKYFTLIILFIIGFTSCQQDSICIDATTPSLVIRFNDFEDEDEYKTVLLDSVWVEDKELYASNESLDSLYIPLDLNENFTIYNLASGGLVDQMKVVYTRKDVFVGRSCGYKTIFEDFKLESNTNNWIKDIEINNTIIDNDTTAHVSIFH